MVRDSRLAGAQGKSKVPSWGKLNFAARARGGLWLMAKHRIVCVLALTSLCWTNAGAGFALRLRMLGRLCWSV